MLIKTKTIKVAGIDAIPVICECEITQGLGIHMVGLVDTAVKESLLRTVTALQASGYRIPGKKIIVNLAPADLRKDGSSYDLPIALAMLAASGQIELPGLEDAVILGELALDGQLRQVPGAVQAFFHCKDASNGIKTLVLPFESAKDLYAAFGDEVENGGVRVYGAMSLPEAINALKGNLPAIQERIEKENSLPESKQDFWSRIKDNELARRALEIAAAGGHNMLIIGAPGSGKATIAQALVEILPPSDAKAYEETAKVYSATEDLKRYLLCRGGHPFRAPHNSASLSAMLGGGSGDTIRPGEVSLANNGVLYMDEFACWPKAVTEALRSPLEDKKVVISRLRSKVEFPSRFQLVAAMNPCPCGYYGEGDRCTCTPRQRQVYMSRLSTPVYDRIDLQVWTHQTQPEGVENQPEDVNEVRKRVAAARKIQKVRFGGTDRLNCDMSAKEIELFCPRGENVKELLEKVIVRLGLSVRAYLRILRIARTIADLDGRENISTSDIYEAAGFRFLDRLNNSL